MIRWNIDKRIAAKGWEKPNHLAIGAGLTYPVARRVWQAMESGKRIDRLDTDTLEKLRIAFGVNDPFTLLKYEPDKSKR